MIAVVYLRRSRSSEDAEIAPHASRQMPQNYKTVHIFLAFHCVAFTWSRIMLYFVENTNIYLSISTPLVILSKIWDSGPQDIMIWVGFCMQVTKTQTYPAMCRFPLFVAL